MSSTATIIGYGSQGRAQALNLRDSGWAITVAVRHDSPSMHRALADDMTVVTDITAAIRDATIVALLTSDQSQPAIWQHYLQPHLPKDATLLFAHGYAIHYGLIQPRSDIDVVLAGPMCPGDELRRRYSQRETIPIIAAVHQAARDDTFGGDGADGRLMRYIDGITGGRHDIINTTFAQETETDLFSEQALLCGGLGFLVQAVYDLLCAAGYNEKLAYYTATKEPVNLARLIADHGVDGMLDRISATARYGAITRGPRIIDDHVQTTLKTILREIQDGRFAEELQSAKK